MENCKNSHSKQLASEDQSRTAFEYSFPKNDAEETESNKSTPYFTPLEFFQSSFEFPSPTLDKSVQSATKHGKDLDCSLTPPAGSGSTGYETPRALDQQSFENAKKPPTPKTFTAVNPKQMPSTSPAFHRKLRRFSLYERRSCSPQHLLIRNTSGSVEANVLAQAVVVDDKENTKPKQPEQNRDENMFTTQSGNNSPIALFEDTNSPNIMAANESRLPYSPKLLASFNTLNLGGSPLGVISSAGYKNGNYFKFPEVDHVVQENSLFAQVEESTTHRDNHWLGRQNQNVSVLLGNTSPALSTTHHKSRFKTINQNEEKNEDSKLLTRTDKKNRKNKNNLTIKISDVNNSHFLPQTPSPKPKTPTIKSTKEKALSLDSAAGASELSIVVLNRDQVCVSCDEIDSQDIKLASNPLKQCGTAMSHEQLLPEAVASSDPPSNRSTSLSHLSSLTADVGNLYSSSFGHFNKAKILAQTPRRKMIKAGSNEWLHYHRKQNPFNQRAESTALKESTCKKELSEIKGSGKTKAILLKTEEKFYPKHIQSSSNTPQSSVAAPHRGLHKHNPLLHASNTNLKTLPEFLTLVEFTNNATQSREHEYPYKQKSFDMPSSSTASSAHNPLNLRSKAITSNSATNLLQRRGSNHSLTLNLHGSCGNLLGSCRSGLSISNYSLGSAANSTTNLNSKSSYNLDLTTTSNAQTLNVATTSQTMAQDVKQSLFRRRGSNNSLTLQLNATSCGNLNSFCSQNSLYMEGNQLLPSTGVTRTTSFITPTKNTTSSTQKRGLLERRGSNQSLTLNMSASFGGVGGTERQSFATGSTEDVTSTKLQHDCSQKSVTKLAKDLLPIVCSQSHHRKFFSSENLSKANTQFSDLNHAHKRNSQQVCFGSVSDLQPSCSTTGDQSSAGVNINVNLSREQVDFQESTVCTCTGVRNITTRPLSPQTTSEEFKVYLANIQMLQNASNALNQYDLIKLNHIFDNSYAPASNKLETALPEQSLSLLSTEANKGRDSPPCLLATSEDCEVAERYLQSVQTTLSSIKLGDDMQKRIFCELHKEFWDLPLNHQEKPMVFGSQSKNRYKTILPNENSRVILENEWKCLFKEGKATGKQSKDNPISSLGKSLDQNVVSTEAPYINANYIKGPDFTSKCYVATQGPLPNTIFEFWLMVYQNAKKHLEHSQHSSNGQNFCQYHQKIVMLTNFLENHRQKCSVYFPIELNELFLATEGHETISIAKEVEQFFQSYLTQSDNDEDKLRLSTNDCFGILESKCIDLPVYLHQLLPLNSNYFFIKNIGIVRKNGFSIRKLSVLFCINTPTHNTEPESRKLHVRRFCCYHYWYPDWPDHRSPKDINTLLDICLHILNLGKCEQEFEIFCDKKASPQQRTNTQHVDQYQQDIFNDAQPLPVIHCSAGIGRTGCLVAILNGVRQLRQSLAFSLISMAAGASNHESSPVDFRLPVEFMQQFDENDVVSYTDTDSSFTRNTLLYVNYILEKLNSFQKDVIEKSTTVASEAHACDDYRQARINRRFAISRLPKLSDLPKLPDVYVDVLGIVCNLRLQRGGMVQNSEQYELIHRAICLYLKRTFALKRF